LNVRLVLLCFLLAPSLATSKSPEAQMLDIPLDGWRLVTDGVMGGVSRGEMQRTWRDGKECLRLTGRVSTENNGGFVQVARDLRDAELSVAGNAQGIRLLVAGNDEPYNVHLRTAGLWFPWQAYRATFATRDEWTTIDIPFTQFQAHKTSQAFDATRLKRIGIVAIGRDFNADLCVARIGFY